LRLFSFGGYGLALVALALVVFGAYDSYPIVSTKNTRVYKNTVLYNSHSKCHTSAERWVVPMAEI